MIILLYFKLKWRTCVLPIQLYQSWNANSIQAKLLFSDFRAEILNARDRIEAIKKVKL